MVWLLIFPQGAIVSQHAASLRNGPSSGVRTMKDAPTIADKAKSKTNMKNKEKNGKLVQRKSC